MLSALLDSIRTQFGSKSYWLSGMLPLLLFLAASVFTAYPHYPWLLPLLTQAEGWEAKTFKYSLASLLLIVLAYLLSTLSSVLLRLLEGRIGPLAWLSRFLCPAHRERLRRIDLQYRDAVIAEKKITGRKGAWLTVLKDARALGRTMHPLTPQEAEAWPTTDAGRILDTVRAAHARNQWLEFDKLDEAVTRLANELRAHRAGSTGVLSEAQFDLEAAIQYARDGREFDKRRLLQQRQTTYPGVRPTSTDQPETPVANNILAPTTLGNIGRTIGTYTLVRYQMDLDIFWTRLQNSLQKDAKEYYAVLQDSKVQVDAMVTLCWASVAYTLLWLSALLTLPAATARQFLTVGISGTLATMMFYTLACESYRVFAEVMRSSVDLFRFQVLKALSIGLPADTNDEKALWVRLGNATGFLDPEVFQYKTTP